MIRARNSDEEPSARRRRLLQQLGKVVQASLSLTMVGSLLSYPSALYTDLARHNTTIYNTHISMDGKEDRVASLLTASSLLGAWLGAALATRMGRRRTMMVNGVLGVTGWLVLALIPHPNGILAGRCVSGLGLGGTSVTTNAYVAELSDPDVRGMMMMTPNLSLMIGQVLSVSVGYGARYYVTAFVCALVPAGFILALMWLPESPSFLVIKGREEEARKILYNLRGRHANLQAEIDSYKALNRQARHGPSWRSLLKPAVLKSLLVVSALFIITSFCGQLVITANASRLFEEAGTTVDGNMAAVVIMLVQIGAGVGGFFLTDRIGRRNILFTGFTLMSASLMSMAIYAGITQTGSASSPTEGEELGMLSDAVAGNVTVAVTGGERRDGWIPLACLVGSQTGAAMGVATMPFVLSQEYFPTSIRPRASSVCFTVYTVAMFSALQLYTPMLEGLTQAGLYAFYGSVSLVGIPYTAFCITETMGKNVG